MNQLLFVLASAVLDGEDIKIIGGIVVIYILGLILVGLYFFFMRFYIAYRMAQNRRRNILLWVLLSMFVSPIGVWIALAVLGEKKEGENYMFDL